MSLKLSDSFNESFKDSVPPPDDEYWIWVRLRAHELNADGCSHVADFYLDACLEHDIHYRTHSWLDETPIFRSEADTRFRKAIQSRSAFGVASPMSWWRWAAVRLFGQKAWDS